MQNKRSTATATGWHRPLAFPIELRDGHIIETMAQAAGLMTQRLPKQRQTKAILAARRRAADGGARHRLGR
jgi:ribosomal protein RSM22 (predicted rRNA methylase)